jgi:hypothetical protein
MSAIIVRLLSHASAASVSNIGALIHTAIFCGIGLLLSLSVLIFNQSIPGEWF